MIKMLCGPLKPETISSSSRKAALDLDVARRRQLDGCSLQCHLGSGEIGLRGLDGDDLLVVSHPGGSSYGLPECMSHATRYTIGAGAGSDLVLSYDIVRINTDLEMVRVLRDLLGEISVSRYARGL